MGKVFLKIDRTKHPVVHSKFRTLELVSLWANLGFWAKNRDFGGQIGEMVEGEKIFQNFQKKACKSRLLGYNCVCNMLFFFL